MKTEIDQVLTDEEVKILYQTMYNNLKEENKDLKEELEGTYKIINTFEYLYETRGVIGILQFLDVDIDKFVNNYHKDKNKVR